VCRVETVVEKRTPTRHTSAPSPAAGSLQPTRPPYPGASRPRPALGQAAGPFGAPRAREPQWWGPAGKAGYFACRSDPSDDPAAPPSPTSARRRTSSGSRGKPSAPASTRGPHARASEWPCGAPTKACPVSRRSLNDPGCVRPWRQFASMVPPCSSLPGAIALRVTSCSRRRSSAP
jgi:hypothetical protein